MRKNFPINNNEIRLRPNQYLISKTDLKGRIVYANPAFIEVSGFTRDELIGKAHNVVRHPEMPAVAFSDLWKTLQAGKSWLGIVKNRRKDGGFYWVQAFVAPIIEQGSVTGYSSVRTLPTNAQVKAAESAYEKINKGTLRGYSIKEGLIVKTGWRRYLNFLKMPFSNTHQAKAFRLFALTSGAMFTLHYVGALSHDDLLRHAFTTACLAVIFVYGWRLVNQIRLPMRQASAMAEQIAAGNLMVDIENVAKEDQSSTDLLFVFSIMRKGLHAIAEDTHESIRASMQAVEEINEYNQLLADRTQTQGGSLQETAASMEELTVTVQQNADNTRQAMSLAERSMATAQQGGQAVEDLIVSMRNINESSKKITDIVNLIDSIAFQTNILALNAAVESARAGEAGRGFAVVAGEVRSLAQRSAEAANEIKILIDESVQRINQGAAQAELAGGTMVEMVGSVQHVNQIITEIASASSEQATGLHQIHQAITQIDDVTQQNTTLVRDFGGAIAQLSAHMDTLDQSIRVLNTGTNKDPKSA